MNKFLGVGLVQATSLAVYTMIIIVLVKVILIKYPVKGLSDVVNTI